MVCEGLQDFYTNLGYVFGPMIAGFLADHIGNGITFTYLGFFSASVAVILLILTPKHINVAERLALQEKKRE